MRKRLSFPVILLLFWLLLAAAGPLALSLHPSEIHLERRLEGPSSVFPLGTDELGRDLLSRIVFGSRLSLKLTMVSLSLSLLLGGLLGALAGFKGGVADIAISRLIDVLLALPGILLAILILAFFRRGEYSLVLALTISSWVGYARTARAMARQLRGQSFIEAASLSGGGFVFIFRKHLLPNIFPVLAAQATVGAASIIMAESGLSFLGLGVPPPIPSLGGILTNGCDYMLEAPHIIVFTSISMLSVLWGLYKLSDDLRTMRV